jgi:hypothetical protein
MGSHHLFARRRQCSPRSAYLGDRATEIRNRQADALSRCGKLVAQCLHPCRPPRIELMAEKAGKRLPAADAVACGQLQQFLFDRFEGLLLALQLREQIRDTGAGSLKPQPAPALGLEPRTWSAPVGKFGKLRPRAGQRLGRGGRAGILAVETVFGRGKIKP